jgi:hypothetical protein
MLSTIDGVAPPPNPPPNPPSVACGSKEEIVEPTASVKDVGSNEDEGEVEEEEEESDVVVASDVEECFVGVVEENVVDVMLIFTDSA